MGLAVANFCSAMIFYLLVPAMASHAAEAFGASAVEGGALASIFFIGALGARLFSGWLTDRFGPRHLALAAGAFYVVTTAAYLLAPTLGVMMVVRLLNGIGFGLMGSALISGMMMSLPGGRRAEGAGWFSVGISVAIGLGPWLALTLAEGPFGMRIVFVAAIVAAALGFALVVVFRHGLPTREPDAGPPPAFSPGSLLDRRALGMGTVVLLGGFAYSAVLTLLDPATRGTELAPTASVFFLVYAVVVLGWRPAAGTLQDRLGEGRLLVPSLAGFIVAMALVAWASTPWLLLAAAVLLGFTWGTVTTGGQAAVVSRVPRERTGAAVATHFFMLDLGTGLGPILLTNLVAGVGYTGVFWAATAVSALALPVYLADLRRFSRRGTR